MTNVLAKIDSPMIMMHIASPADILTAQQETTALITGALKQGVDYGLIPGTGKKESLFKAGAERLNNAFGVYPDYFVTDQEVDHDREFKWQKKQKKWSNKFNQPTLHLGA